MIWKRVCKVLGLVCLVCAAKGQASLSHPSAERVKKILEKYNVYLKNLKNLKTSFIQISPNGTKSTGMLYLKKPGKLRLIYDPHGSIELISNGKNLIHYDGRTKENSSVALRDTPLYFLLEKGNLEELAQVQKIILDKKWSQIIVTNKRDPESGSVTLVFQENPIALVRWILVEADGRRTIVTLSNWKTNLTIHPKTFEMQ
jgi:outer membrane lipoprotein-sorting protein